jgi:translation initiation factor IF-2
LVLLVFTLAIHPFKLPDQNRAIDLELLPPLPSLTPPPTPTVKVQLQPRKTEPSPPPQAPVRVPITPEAQTLPKAVEVKPQPTAPTRQLLDQARPQQSELQPPVEVDRRAVQTKRLQTQQAVPQIPEAPPEQVQVNRQAPALQPSIEVPRVQAPGRARSLDTTRAAPVVPQAAAPEAPAAPATPAPAPSATAPSAAAPSAAAPEAAAPAAPSPVQVLTNQNVIQSPVEIRPREVAPLSPRVTTQPGAAEIPAPPAGGGAPPGGAPPGGQAGAQGGGGRPQVRDFNGIDGINGGYGAKGMRQALGCEDPDTYKLSAEDRAACLERFGQRGRNAPDLGLAVAANKQAQYERYEACQNAYRRKGIAGATDKFEGSSVAGLVPMPKECLPLENR